MDNTGCYIIRFCLLWKKATNERQNRLIYQPISSTSEKKLGDIPTITVHNRQNRVIYQPILFITYNIGRYTNQYYPRQTKHGDKPTITVHERQNRLIYPLILSKQDTSVKYTTQYCPRPTKPVDIPTIFVHNRQNRLIYTNQFLSTTETNLEKYQPLLSITDKTG